jgi:Flp pilus assembly protein TadG
MATDPDQPRQQSRPCRHQPGGERGAGTVELVLATPLLMLLLMGIVQFAVWSHASHVAQAAAAQGLAAARVTDGTPADGHTAATEFLAQLADGPLQDGTVDVTRDPATVTVRISGTAAQVVPFLQLPVHAEAAGPVERFISAG